MAISIFISLAARSLPFSFELHDWFGGFFKRSRPSKGYVSLLSRRAGVFAARRRDAFAELFVSSLPCFAQMYCVSSSLTLA